MSFDTVWLSVGAAALAVCFHISIIPYEIDYQLKPLFGLYLASIGGIYYVLIHQNLPNAGITTLVTAASFNASLIISILTYRVFLHRTRRFPGPFMARVSKFYSVFLARKLHYNKEVEKLHRKYGDFVRTGPREISILRVSAVQAIYSSQSPCEKAPFYSQAADHPNSSVHSERVRSAHNQRRRGWDRGFSIAALKEYEPRVAALTSQLISQLRARIDTPVDITAWNNYYGFDVMGDVGFGRPWGLMESDKMHNYIHDLHAAMAPIGMLGAVPWLLRLLIELPGATAALQGFMDWCEKQMLEKMKHLNVDDKPKDVVSWILTDSKFGTKQPMNALAEDSRLIIVAGSDTTAATLTCAFYHLAKNPAVYKKLQRCVDTVFPGGDKDFNYTTAASSLPFLEGVINETLRLTPAVPAALMRTTPLEGLTIDEVYIPGDVAVSVPTYTLQRDERYFEKALEFIPERWTMEKAHMVKDKRAFIPFSTGIFGCVGKNLALMELRMVLARVALNFDVEFAEGEDGRGVEEESKDTFTLTVPSMYVKLTERAR